MDTRQSGARKQTLREAWALYRWFFRIGWFAFGGGWSIIAQMQKEFVDRRGDMTEAQVLDLVSVARSIPGTMITNTAYLFGASRGGLVCAVFATLGLVTPSFLLFGALTLFYDSFHSNLWVARALVGVRAAVVPIVFSAALKLRKGALVHPACYAACLAACLIALLLRRNNLLIILTGALLGALSAEKLGGAA